MPLYQIFSLKGHFSPPVTSLVSVEIQSLSVYAGFVVNAPISFGSLILSHLLSSLQDTTIHRIDEMAASRCGYLEAFVKGNVCMV